MAVCENVAKHQIALHLFRMEYIWVLVSLVLYLLFAENHVFIWTPLKMNHIYEHNIFFYWIIICCENMHSFEKTILFKFTNSFKGSRDQGLNARRTRFVIMPTEISPWNFVFCSHSFSFSHPTPPFPSFKKPPQELVDENLIDRKIQIEQ